VPYKTKPRGVSGYGIRDLFRAVAPRKIHKKLWKNRPGAQLSMRLGLEVQGTELDGKRMMQCNGARRGVLLSSQPNTDTCEGTVKAAVFAVCCIDAAVNSAEEEIRPITEHDLCG
jgi:hypothetical protein